MLCIIVIVNVTPEWNFVK